jgi:GNAT superfamily N-acetyltransferase
MIAQEYQIRLAQPGDIAALPEIEREAGQLFKAYPQDLGLTDEIYARVNSVDTFDHARQDGRLWVATSPTAAVVGFALVLEIDSYAHLEELDVLPSHGRRGIGSALLQTVCSWARERRYRAVTLRTFRDVPWNGPFYRSRGFQVVDSSGLSTEHAGLEAAEQRRGLRTDLRVTMAYQAD